MMPHPLRTEIKTPCRRGELDVLTDKLIEQLKTVFDPEIPVDVYELGLIYKVDVSDVIRTWWTSSRHAHRARVPGGRRNAGVGRGRRPRDPRSEVLQGRAGVRSAVGSFCGMSDEAKLQLNMVLMDLNLAQPRARRERPKVVTLTEAAAERGARSWPGLRSPTPACVSA